MSRVLGTVDAGAGRVLGSASPTTNHLDGFATIDNRDFIDKAGSFLKDNNVPGAQVGAAVGDSIGSLSTALKFALQGKFSEARAALKPGGSEASPLKVGGDALRAAVLPVSLAVAAPASATAAALQYGAFGAAQGAGDALADGKSLPEVGKEALFSGAIGAVTGGAFNLLGKGLSAVASKTGPSALSFTSGVPKTAIQQAADNPALAKEGLGMSVNEVRTKAVSSLQTLHNTLGSEFKQGLTNVGTDLAPTAQKIPATLLSEAQDIARQFKITTSAGAKGLAADFSNSAIVKGGEETAVRKALETISTWSDFSPQGMQTLSERIGALRNFESGAQTQSSAVVGKIYHAVGDAIEKTYPDLAALRTNYATNRKVLDEIGNVLSADKTKPTSVQASVSRLDNLFKDNKDEYINIIRQLGERSGVDFLSLLAGGEFQKVLPGFVRGLGGGGAVGIGASVLNPYLLLLAPLFSPRAVGAITRNAKPAATAAAQITRAIATQTIPQIQRAVASPQAK